MTGSRRTSGATGVVLALALCAALVAGACGSDDKESATGTTTAGAEGATIRLGFSAWPGWFPWQVAEEKGLFGKAGLDVKLTYFESYTDSLNALNAGKLDANSQTLNDTISSVGAGAEEVVVLANDNSTGNDQIIVKPGIESIADLKGKKVGVSNPGSTSDIATRVGLAGVGLVPDKDVTIIAVGSSQNRTAALQSGQIQGGLDQPPFSYDLEALGLHSLFSMAEKKLPIVNNGVVVKRSYLNANRAVVQRYVDSLVQAIAKIKKDKAFSVGVYKKYLKIDDETKLGRTWEYATTELFPALPYPKVDQFNDIVPELAKRNEKAKTYDVSKMIDESFVKSAADRGLDKQP